jgi:hypothetical protein
VFLAANLLAPRLAKIGAFFRSCPVHVWHHTLSARCVQPAYAGDLHFWQQAGTMKSLAAWMSRQIPEE